MSIRIARPRLTSPHRSLAAAALGMFFLSGVLASTQTLGRVVPPGSALVLGKVHDLNEAPVPRARLRLRSLNSLTIEHRTTGDQAGEFSFVVTSDVPYVVEMVNAAGRVIAVGEVITAQAGDVAHTVLVVPSLRPAAAMLGGTAGSVLLAATGIGVTVLPLVSPER